jgi:toxin YoeB
MEIVFTSKANEDLLFFVKSGNKGVLKKISQLTDDMRLNPTSGLGKPEQLKHTLRNCWSRRINKEHRIVYEIENAIIYVYSLKGHY